MNAPAPTTTAAPPEVPHDATLFGLNPVPEPRKDSAALLRMDIRDVLQAEIGMNEPFAELVSDALCRGLRSRWGGREIYVPAEDLAERNTRIRQAFKGNNAAEVMFRFGISRATLYRVINER